MRRSECKTRYVFIPRAVLTSQRGDIRTRKDTHPIGVELKIRLERVLVSVGVIGRVSSKPLTPSQLLPAAPAWCMLSASCYGIPMLG